MLLFPVVSILFALIIAVFHIIRVGDVESGLPCECRFWDVFLVI